MELKLLADSIFYLLVSYRAKDDGVSVLTTGWLRFFPLHVSSTLYETESTQKKQVLSQFLTEECSGRTVPMTSGGTGHLHQGRPKFCRRTELERWPSRQDRKIPLKIHPHVSYYFHIFLSVRLGP